MNPTQPTTILIRCLMGLIVLLLMTACGPKPEPELPVETDWSLRVAELTDEAWDRLAEDILYFRVKLELPITQFPDVTPEATAEQSAFARSLLQRINEVPVAELEPEDALTLAMLRWNAESTLAFEPFYWLQFPYTPYVGGFAFNSAHQALVVQSLASPGDLENYLGLLEEYGDQIDQLRRHAEGQAERGIYLAKAALPGVVGMFRAFREGAPSTLAVSASRLAGISEEDQKVFQQAIKESMTERILPAFDAFLDFVGSDAYADEAPEAVGLSQYPDGEAFYRTLVRFHTTMELTPEALHELGKKSVENLAATRSKIRKALGFSGTQEAFEEQLKKDPRFLAETPSDVEARYMAYIAEIEPVIPDLFLTVPKAPYGVQRLPEASEAGMTFGYYQAPTPLDTTGRYLYNGSRLDQRSLLTAGPLIFHELIPGHHFQIALQNENESLPLYRREAFSATAFTEGWANYAAYLAVEQGLLEEPLERYAWAVFDTFFSVRLVVDTGMNLLGWSLEEARAYMREHLFESDTEIATESLRYSTDMPGQALAYKAGFERFLELREQVRSTQGEDFDIRAFHEAVLGSGALPLTLLETHLEQTFGTDI